jgi:hypothetical protein
MRGHSTETVPGNGLPNFKCANKRDKRDKRDKSGAMEREACSGPVAPGDGCPDRSSLRAGSPDLTQHRSSHIQALAPLGCAVSQVVKNAQSRGRLSALLFAGALAGRRSAADRLDPSLLMSHYCLLHPTHHADERRRVAGGWRPLHGWSAPMQGQAGLS